MCCENFEIPCLSLGSFKIYFLFYLYGCFNCIYVSANICVLFSGRPEEGIGLPGTGIKDTFELLCQVAGNRTLVLCLSRQLLTAEPSISPAPRELFFFFKVIE